jgi:hypothetical protein
MDNYYTTTLSGKVTWRNPITPHTIRNIVEYREYLDGTIKLVDSSGRVINVHELSQDKMREIKLDYLQSIETMYKRRRDKISLI